MYNVSCIHQQVYKGEIEKVTLGWRSLQFAPCAWWLARCTIQDIVLRKCSNPGFFFGNMKMLHPCNRFLDINEV
jgi:hypothetical protein